MTDKAKTTQEHQEKLSEKSSQSNHETKQEINGRTGPEPTRYGDWEKNGRCIDF